MRKIFFSIISLSIMCCVVAGFATIAAKAEESEPDYAALLGQGETEKAQQVFFDHIGSRVSKLGTFGSGPLAAALEYNIAVEIAIEMANFYSGVLETEQYDFGITVCDDLLERYGYKKMISHSAKDYRGMLWGKKGQYAKAIEDYTNTTKVL
jgi:hypothetical protein